MKWLMLVCHWGRIGYDVLEKVLGPLVDLFARLYIARVFFQAGLAKVGNWTQEDWERTVALFTDEYRTPFLSPATAAFLGAAQELIFPVLLVLGLGGRIASLGLFAVNVMAVVSYYHVLGQPEQTATLTIHFLWGAMLALMSVHGPGKLSLDHLIAKRWPTLGR